MFVSYHNHNKSGLQFLTGSKSKMSFRKAHDKPSVAEGRMEKLILLISLGLFSMVATLFSSVAFN
ncbi:MAG: hypothetical protein NDI69_07600 [Bacteriovoracaceae bacterium]|nr:hypothetical protein [Bacteriovoracaceae bacterium]